MGKWGFHNSWSKCQRKVVLKDILGCSPEPEPISWEARRDLTKGKGGMLPLANHLRGGEADDRVQSTQLWLNAKHLGSNPSNQVILIKENLISKYFQCLLCASRQLWLEWMTFKSYSTPQTPLLFVPDASYYVNWIFMSWTEHLLAYVDVQTKAKVINYFFSTLMVLL